MRLAAVPLLVVLLAPSAAAQTTVRPDPPAERSDTGDALLGAGFLVMFLSAYAIGCDDGFGMSVPCSETFNRRTHFVNPITNESWRKWTFVGGVGMMVSGAIFNSLNSPVRAEADHRSVKGTYTAKW